jgi:hypothetical protein
MFARVDGGSGVEVQRDRCLQRHCQGDEHPTAVKIMTPPDVNGFWLWLPTRESQTITPIKTQTVAAIPDGSSINLLERIASSIGMG